jgi:MFS family permease
MDRDGLTVMPEAAPSAAIPAAPAGAPPDYSAPDVAAAAVVDASAENARRPLPVPAGTKAGALRALRTPAYRLYFLGQVASVSGTFLQVTAIGWLVLQLTGSATDLGLVLAASSLPTLVLGVWGGSLVDRLDLRRLLIATQTAFGLLAAVLWVFAAKGTVSVGLLVMIGVAGGLVSVVDSPARQTIAGMLVSPADLASAVSLNGVLVNSARVVGPAIAGVLIATVGTTPCFAVNAVSYVAVVAALVAIRSVRQDRRRHDSGGVRQGLRYARSMPQLWLPLSMMALVGLLAFNFGVLLPVVAQRQLGGGGATYGLISAVLSVGSVVGSLGAGVVGHPRRVYLVGAAVAFGIGLAATAATSSVPVACVTLTLTGAAAFLFVTMSSTTLQLHSTPEYRGRIMALFGLVYLGTTPIGSPLTGWIISTAGTRVALLIAAAACLVAGGGAWLVRTPPGPEPPAG